jgi:FMN-dependent NADH-azoreductase
MANVLVIKANDRPADQAVSVQMYDAFVKSYKESHSGDNVTELDLFKEALPDYGNVAMTGLFKLNAGMEPTAEEAQGAATVKKYLDLFLAADKVVFAFPTWNTVVPAPLVNFISYISQAGVTFKYTEAGPVGLAGDKKVLLLNARGSDYSLPQMQPYEVAVKYVATALNLLGIQSPEVIVIEGHNQYPDRSAEIVADGIARTAKAAASF